MLLNVACTFRKYTSGKQQNVNHIKPTTEYEVSYMNLPTYISSYKHKVMNFITTKIPNVRFEVFTATEIQVVVFWPIIRVLKNGGSMV
jgi:hypothetical protein